MRNDSASSPTPELKKGSVELLVLSVLAHGPRHGYEVGRLIELASGELGRVVGADRGWTRL